MKNKITKLVSLTLAVLFLATQGMAQTPAPAAVPQKPLTVTGTMNIQFATRGANKTVNSVDTYNLDVNIANSAVFKGTIVAKPVVKQMMSANKMGKLTYSLDALVVNPNNPLQTKDVGRVFGEVPVDDKNVYRFEDGFVKISILPIGQAKGFESRFSGIAIGKPPAVSGVAKIKQDTMRLVSGKGGAVTLKNYDVMRFQNVVLAAGPVQIYPEVTVAGDMVYDYDRSIWYFKNVTFTYGINGVRLYDTLTGTIRWIEDANRKTNGQGHYDFDVRVNEPPPNENAVFAGTSDESSFFTTDDSIAGLTGSISYKDSMNGEVVLSSAVKIDLKSNKLNKQQVMCMSKLLFFTMTVPFNAE
jgi:hypothetical protein